MSAASESVDDEPRVYESVDDETSYLSPDYCSIDRITAKLSLPHCMMCSFSRDFLFKKETPRHHRLSFHLSPLCPSVERICTFFYFFFLFFLRICTCITVRNHVWWTHLIFTCGFCNSSQCYNIPRVPVWENPAFSTTLYGSCLKTGQHSIFVITRKIKRIIHVCWIPYLLKIL